MAVKQLLNDQGAVIGYHPDLSYETAATPSYEVEEKKEYSKAVDSYLINSPTSVLRQATNALSRIEELLASVSSLSTASDTLYGSIETLIEYLETNNPLAEAFVSYHASSVTGDTMVELYYYLFQEKTLLEQVLASYTKVVFGEDAMTTEEMKQAASVVESKLKKYQESAPHKVNTFALAQEVKLNTSINALFDQISLSTTKVVSFLYRRTGEDIYKENKDLVEEIFTEVNTTFGDTSSFYLKQIKEAVVTNVMGGYYTAATKAIDATKRIGFDSSDSLLAKYSNKYMETSNMVLYDVCKACKGNYVYFDSLLQQLFEKDILRVSYNNAL